ncbi:MAG: hypothetical protein EOO20_00300 [Chryseobacterium sp.]|nr:MAG: hypothetical protein EOO20_00300 [Chryseobacterium sp.]
MVLATSRKLLNKLLEEVAKQESKNENPNTAEDGILEIIQQHIGKLKELVLATTFESTEEEIIFFKHIKPQFISLQLYYLKLADFNLQDPTINKKAVRNFYEKELKKIQHFFKLNGNMLNYYRSEAKEMDEQLFLRGLRVVPSWLVKRRTDADERFSTIADHLIARIMAAEKMYVHILHVLNGLELKFRPVNAPESSLKLKWTGESINLVEIAYGIWLTGQINNGNATISEIVRWLESTLSINVGRAYRRWTEISRRDNTTTTKYLDRMREMITIRLINEDDLKRQKRNSLKK